MNLMEKIKSLTNKGGKKLSQDPNSVRFNFISNEEIIRKQHLDEYKVWFIGSSDELSNYYLTREVGGNAKDPIYNRNHTQYFWGLTERECHIKKVHTGIPRSAIITLVNAIGTPKIKCVERQEDIDKILDFNNFKVLLNQQARPLTLAEGYGAYKITFDKSISDLPIIQYYEAQDVDYITKYDVITGIVFRDYYEYQNKKYVLTEVRRVEDNNSLIEFKLYRLEKSNEIIEVGLDTIPELANLQDVVLPNFKEILAVPNKYFHDPLNKAYGLSILAGKIDIADDMDMLASVCSLTERNSSPVEYYPVDLLKRDKNGNPELPPIFGRTYVKKPVVPSADGGMEGKIDISAPQLNFSQYYDALVQKTNIFLSGMLSPVSMGNNLARNDNALAQREKEKVTMLTRNNIMDMEESAIKKLIKLCLVFKEYNETGKITITDYDISVMYDEFASPTFDEKIKNLLPMLNDGAISPELFVDKMWEDLDETKKQEQVNWIKEQIDKQNIDLGAFDENGNTSDIPETVSEEETLNDFKA